MRRTVLRPVPAPSRQCGFTLVELLVSMVIGLVMLGAMCSAYLAAVQSRRMGQSMNQMTEDASAAMSVLRGQVAMAGFSRPIGADGQQRRLIRVLAEPQVGLFGCDGAFDDLDLPLRDLSCATNSGSLADSVALGFEADDANSLVRLDQGQIVPLDCLGNSLEPTGEGATRHFLAYSQFYVSASSLYCRGPGAPGGQALVENIADLQLSYGVAMAGGDHVVQYLPASGVSAIDAWSRVLSVRVCLVVRSAEEVLEQPAPFAGCEPFSPWLTPVDRRLHRSFTTTIVLHNRAAGGDA